MHSIKLKQVILHILDNNHAEPILSAGELFLEREVEEFLEKHLSRVLNDGELKEAYFDTNDNPVLQMLKGIGQDGSAFVEVSRELANRLFTIMYQNPEIPSGDVICCTFDLEEAPYFAVLKLNYRNSYIHYVSNTADGNVNNLVKQKTALPGESQRVDECVIANLGNLNLKLLEKQYTIDGKKEYYLSKSFLKCRSELSCLQKIKILDKAVGKITKTHLSEEFDKVTKLRSNLAESLEESSEVKVREIAEAVFGHNTAFKEEYLAEVKKAGLVEESFVVPETNTASKKFRIQKLKTDIGIEINFPSHFYNDKDVMEFINNPDGSISILIKNVNKVMNK
ncbi:MAG: nucleoid-associated protein [Carboxydocellales bacterium]